MPRLFRRRAESAPLRRGLRRPGALSGALLLGGIAACYTGFGSVGAFCESTADCGADQACENQICGVCNDEQLQPGELCLGSADEIQLGGLVRLMPHVDLDADGDMDLIAATNQSCIATMGDCWFLHILINRGDGTFDSQQSAPFEGAIESATLSLLDDQDTVDAAFTTTASTVVVVALNIFNDDSETLYLVVPGNARSVRAGDFNADGHKDLVVAADSADNEESLYVFDGDGQGGFAPYRGTKAGLSAWIAPVSDLDGDQDLDLVVANIQLSRITTLLNDGDGNFTVNQLLEAGDTPVFVAVEDLNGDGHADIAAANSLDSSLSLFMGQGGGEFAPAEILETGPRPVFIEIGDINADEKPDLIVANADDDKLSIFLGREDGFFPDQVEFDVSSTPTWVIREDFNGDSWPDLAVAAGSSVSFSFATP